MKNKIFFKRIFTLFISGFFTVMLLSNRGIRHVTTKEGIKINLAVAHATLYDTLELGNLGLSKAAYSAAVKGFDSLRNTGILLNAKVLSIVDFSLPSNKKRLFIIDITAGKLLFNTFVSHGRNSGKALATQFSNNFHSFQSSLGFYVTGQTYTGHHGFSLRLNGIEQGINDNAFGRGIVMHAASYVSENSAEKMGCIGRSEGCPAIPINMHRAVIETIKNGSCLFLYGTDRKYISQSKYMQKLQNA
ncbi:MAG: murein L,D-transpeptidase catalytic domain family protein [Bacteroidota bacterium]